MLGKALDTLVERAREDPTYLYSYVASLKAGMQEPPPWGNEARPGVDLVLQPNLPEMPVVDLCTRERILRRDRNHCIGCGCGEGLEVHHIFPRRLGGSLNEDNLVTLCSLCHHRWEANFNAHWKALLGLVGIEVREPEKVLALCGPVAQPPATAA